MLARKQRPKDIDTTSFIEQLQTRENIWNCKLPSHLYEGKKERQELARIFNTTELLVTKKYSNLRTKWRKERNKVMASKKSRAGTRDVYKPSWEWFDSLAFLERSLVKKPTGESLQTRSTTLANHASLEFESPMPATSLPTAAYEPPASLIPHQITQQLSHSPMPVPSTPSVADSTSSPAPIVASRKQQRKDEFAQFLEQAAATIQLIAERNAVAAPPLPSHPQQHMDRFDRFGANVADTLRELNDRQQQRQLMLKIDELIYNFTSTIQY